MNFVKQKWSLKDITEYNEYLYSLKSEDKKCKWEKKITCTSLECLGIEAPVIKDIANKIVKRQCRKFFEIMAVGKLDICIYNRQSNF